MRFLRRYAAPIILVALILACLAGIWNTQRPATDATSRPAAAATTLIDDRLLETARQMAALANSPQEQLLAQEATRWANRTFDMEFTIAMIEAAQAPPPASGPLKQLADRIAVLQFKFQNSQSLVAKLTKDAGKDDTSIAQLELAKAQLTLDQDELAEAREDLVRQGGDRRANLERLRKAHSDVEHSVSSKPPQELPSATLFEQTRAWWTLQQRRNQVQLARQQALNKMALLTRQRYALAKSGTPPPETPAEDEEEVAARIERLKQLADQKRTVTQLDQGLQDTMALSGVYERWAEALAMRVRDMLHQGLQSILPILAVMLVVALVDRAMRYAYRDYSDRRRAHQLRIITNIATQILGGIVIALLIFGPPTQLSTIIGLATAGVTVVMKDFIVAFFGWFILLGKNGVRIGDWVEIEGVGGEVVEIGPLKTVLLEMGNWTSTSHPTGRRVAFMNKYAIEKHYFNFSTAGQWLWDELQMSLPATSDAHHMALQIRDCVEKETEQDARLAEQEWERVTKQYETRTFSAKPSVDLRPSSGGVDVIVRYITRAPQRYEVKSRLFESIINLIRRPASGEPTEQPA